MVFLVPGCYSKRQESQCPVTATERQRTSDVCASTDNEQPSSNQSDKSTFLQGQPWRRGGILCATSRLVCASDRFCLPIAPLARWLTRAEPAVSIKKILNLNEHAEPSETDDTPSNGLSAPAAPISKDGTPIWKLLVFDVSNTAGLGETLAELD
jgi:hypothetical protein